MRNFVIINNYTEFFWSKIAMKKEIERLSKIRNVGIIAHIDAGKTTVSERMLFYTNKIHRMGEVHDGNATMDFMPEEQERGITICAATTFCEWNEYNLNLIDTPGHVDFTIEVARSLRVLDGAVGVFCAVGAVEPQSETVWRQANNLNVPRLVFINKMDRIGADFSNVILSLQEKLRATPIPIQIPLGEGDEFYAIADLINEKKLEFAQEDQGLTIYTKELEGHEQKQVQEWRTKMLESIAENDDEFFNLYLGEEYSIADIENALRRACIGGLVQPTLLGSALKNTGIQPLLDAIAKYLPSPFDIPPLNQENQGKIENKAEEFKALMFKVVLENKRKIAFLRIYQGSLTENMDIYNISQKKPERISRIYRLHADFKEQVATAKAGDIVAVMGIKSARTGDTLAYDPKSESLETVLEYKPVISLAFEPKNSEDALVLDEALERYLLEDPTLSLQLEEVSGNRLVSGMGELHLEVLQERLTREYKIFPRVGNPQVVLRETIQNEEAISTTYIFDKVIGDLRQYGEISLQIKSRERNSGNNIIFNQNCFDPSGHISREMQTIKNEILESAQNTLLSGSQNGYPIQDVELEIMAIPKESFSTSLGFQLATNFGLKEALSKAKIIRLEPIMSLEIQAPEESLGACINLVNTCNGKIENLEDKAGLKFLTALAPMRELFGFSTRLRSVSQGRAGIQIRFHSYDSC